MAEGEARLISNGREIMGNPLAPSSLQSGDKLAKIDLTSTAVNIGVLSPMGPLVRSFASTPRVERLIKIKLHVEDGFFV